jgi:sugar-specific transcriptional regulator TrmB
VLKVFVGFGLSEMDAQVYVLLSEKGPKKAIEISKALRIYKQKLYPRLKNLQNKGVITATLEHPARFSAIKFEKVLDLFIEAKMGEAKIIQQEKAEMLSSQPNPAQEDEGNSARFMVLGSRKIIYSRIKQMINETKNQLLIISTVSGLTRADQFGLFDVALKHPLRSKIKFRFLTHLSEENVNEMKALLKRTPKTMSLFEGRNPDFGLKVFPHMVIRDEEEVAFLINSKADTSASESDNACLWTNCKELIHAFLAVFEDLWSNSTAVENKITEIEDGTSGSKAFVIGDARASSSFTLDPILAPYKPKFTAFPKNILPTREKTSDAKIEDVKALGEIEEKNIFKRVLNNQKIPGEKPPNDTGRIYATVATAIIHPPEDFNLPNMMIFVQKVEKQSTFGAEDALIIFLWLNTPIGYAYVPVANVGDNPRAMPFRRKIFAGTPAEKNFQLVKKDELQIRVHGTTMFAEWTVPILLHPPPYKLPPARILIEGYGEVKTTALGLHYISGFKSQIEENYLDAFVTFFHPSSKHFVPGTDGRFVRDFIATTIPPIDKR